MMKSCRLIYMYIRKTHGICRYLDMMGLLTHLMKVTCYLLCGITAVETEHIWEKTGKVPAVRTCSLHCGRVIQTKQTKSP